MIVLVSWFLPTVGLVRKNCDLICTCRHIHLGHRFSGIQKWYWPSLHFICLDHVVKSACICRSRCLQVWWLLFSCFPLLLTSHCTRRVASGRKKQHRRYLSLLLPILSGQGWVILMRQLLVWNFFCSWLNPCLRVPWSSVPTRITMNHMDLSFSRLLNLTWRLEIGIQ